MADRLEQLLGVAALAAVERLRDALPLSESETGALVHLQAWPGSSVNDLSGVVGLSQPATVRLVDRLVAAGLVRRDPGPDRRTVALVPTEAGTRGADTALAARAGALAPLLGRLDERDRATLERLLGRLVGDLADDHRAALHACRLCDRGTCRSGPGCPLDHTL